MSEIGKSATEVAQDHLHHRWHRKAADGWLVDHAQPYPTGSPFKWRVILKKEEHSEDRTISGDGDELSVAIKNAFETLN